MHIFSLFLGIVWLKNAEKCNFLIKNTSLVAVLGLKISKKWSFLTFFRSFLLENV